MYGVYSVRMWVNEQLNENYIAIDEQFNENSIAIALL